MICRCSKRGITLLASASVLALGLAVAPVAVDFDSGQPLLPAIKSALAGEGGPGDGADNGHTDLGDGEDGYANQGGHGANGGDGEDNGHTDVGDGEDGYANQGGRVAHDPNHEGHYGPGPAVRGYDTDVDDGETDGHTDVGDGEDGYADDDHGDDGGDGHGGDDGGGRDGGDGGGGHG